jgi:hypothetical protein
MLKNLASRAFGRLTVLRRGADRGNTIYWRCRRSCGVVKEVRADARRSNSFPTQRTLSPNSVAACFWLMCRCFAACNFSRCRLFADIRSPSLGSAMRPSKRNFLLCTKRNFSCCGDTRRELT